MTIRFLLRSSKRDQPVPIWLRVRSSNNDVAIRLEALTTAERWDKKTGRPSPINQKLNPDLYKQIEKLEDYLKFVKNKAIIFVTDCEEKGVKVTGENLSKYIEGQKSEDVPRGIADYFDWLIGQMKTGAFMHGSERYDYGTIRAWIVAANVYKRFEAVYEKESGEVLTWDSLDKRVMDAFVLFLEEYGYLTKSANKVIICFKAAIKYASIYHHLHDNLGCLAYLSKRKEVAGCATTKTYLTTEELQALFDMPLEPGSLKDQVRDLFLVGCYTCQRVSDYANIKKSDFGTTKSGTKVIRLTQEKTGAVVVVPILNDNLQSILEKYSYDLPEIKYADIIINRYIKQILKELAEKVPSLAEPVKTILTLPERKAEEAGTMAFERDEEGNVLKPKYETISTHSARRSGITNMYKSGVFTTRQMMSISGHKTEENFFLYVRESSDEIADEIAKRQEEAKRRSNEDLF